MFLLYAKYPQIKSEKKLKLPIRWTFKMISLLKFPVLDAQRVLKVCHLELSCVVDSLVSFFSPSHYLEEIDLIEVD